MDLLAAYDAIVELGAAQTFAQVTQEMRRAFELRTGTFGPDDPWFEARSQAFWDDALTRRRFGDTVATELPAEARAYLAPLARAHRGLFRADRASSGFMLEDLWSGIELWIESPSGGLREALDASSLFDGRVVGTDAPARATLLPGAVFHPEDASEPIGKVLGIARERHMDGHDALDALLRMERNLRSHSRVKAAYAYRAEALTPGDARKG